MKVIAIIGAMYGDEGKGIMTDYFAHKHKNENPIVIRHNGGAQAGHTVRTPDGARHVFSHFGSGSFVGVPTYLSEYFVCNPLLYVKEKDLLNEMGLIPNLYVHPDSLVSTPFDMIINMILEARRGGDRHGSCGVGFGETVARSLSHAKLTVNDLTQPGLRTKLIDIRDNYVPERFKDQPLDRNTNSDAVWAIMLTNNALIDDWLAAVKVFLGNITITSNKDLLNYDTLIFEGAQGLMLDQQSPDFPHVTRSNTGTTNVVHILNQIDVDIESFDVVYVSRAYTTRHGAGPLDFERDLPYDISDATNIPNVNQGSLRFAPLLLDTLSSVTLYDFSKAQDHYPQAEVKVAFTCLDQLSNECLFVAGNALTSSPKEDFVGLLTESSAYVSYGPTRESIRES